MCFRIQRQSLKRPEKAPKRHPKCSKTKFWAVLGHLGLPWAILGPNWGNLGAILELSWDILKSSKTKFRAVLGHLGAILDCLGPSWDPTGAILELSWAILELSWAILKSSTTKSRAVLGHLGLFWAILGPNLCYFLVIWGTSLAPSWCHL
jgi:hypothetical protein